MKSAPFLRDTFRKILWRSTSSSSKQHSWSVNWKHAKKLFSGVLPKSSNKKKQKKKKSSNQQHRKSQRDGRSVASTTLDRSQGRRQPTSRDYFSSEDTGDEDDDSDNYNLNNTNNHDTQFTGDTFSGRSIACWSVAPCSSASLTKDLLARGEMMSLRSDLDDDDFRSIVASSNDETFRNNYSKKKENKMRPAE